MSSEPRRMRSLGSPRPAPMMYTRMAAPLCTTKHDVANDLPDREQDLSEPAHRNDDGKLAVAVVAIADHETPQTLAHRAGPRDHERVGEPARQGLAFDL